MITNDDFILITGASGFIGTNFINMLEEIGFDRFVNFDKAKSTRESHMKYWFEGNIMDKDRLSKAFEMYKPTIVIHLAARTDTLSDNLDDYVENTKGTENIVDEIVKRNCVKHALFASTQYVYKDKIIPFGLSDDSYAPHTVYGMSKKIDEEYIRNSNLQCKWTIFRPCNVWGPWHMRYPNELWKMIAKGFYCQPGNKPAIRTYSYVGNLVKQLWAIINASDVLQDRKTYYLGDMPCDSYIWLNTFSKELTGKNLRRLPKVLFFVGAMIGDILRKFGLNFPIYSMRYHNMIEDFYAPSNVAISLFGGYETSYEKNVKETVDWLRGEGASYFEYWKNHPHGTV